MAHGGFTFLIQGQEVDAPPYGDYVVIGLTVKEGGFDAIFGPMEPLLCWHLLPVLQESTGPGQGYERIPSDTENSLTEERKG